MSSIYPEKIAMYFSSMNSLSAKILSDIQAVEDTVKIDNNLSYNEKSKIIDKHLIYDVIHRNKKKQQQLKGSVGKGTTTVQNNEEDGEDVPACQIFYNDPELDKDQVTALLLSVYPKKPEKYVYEDNCFYVDEHSEPFSYCTQSQASFCELENLVKGLPLPSISIQSSFQSKKSDSKSRIGSHREKKPAPLPNAPPIGHKKYPTKNQQQGSNPPAQHKQTMVPALGVPLMGFGVMPTSKNEKKYKLSGEDDPSNNKDLTKSPDDESNLPQQVQNLDLIAELQAKLKMNKKSSTSSQPGTTSTGNNIPKGRPGHVSKPKAPPPPPPQSTKKTVKLSQSLQNSTDCPDASSTSQRTTTSLMMNKSCNEPDIGTSVPTTNDLKESNPKGTDDDFCVDISSPCRIKVNVKSATTTKSFSKILHLSVDLPKRPVLHSLITGDVMNMYDVTLTKIMKQPKTH